LLLGVVRQLDLHEGEALAPLHNKMDFLYNLLGARVIPSIGNNYEGHNKPPQIRELDQHVALMQCKIF
jgi:hypothetical protein